MVNIVPPERDQFVEKNGSLTERNFSFLQLVAQLDPLTGTGSPEGVVEARVPRFYVDLSGSTGSILYVKQQNAISSDRTTGWILV